MKKKSEIGPRPVCRVCGSAKWTPLYKGRVRMGKFGSLSAQERTVWKCLSCSAGFLEQGLADYESAAYRKMVENDDSPAGYYRMHDQEQLERISRLGTGDLRGKVIADIGCGAGSFLDLVKGFAGTTLAVEPARSYYAELKKKEHVHFPYCKDALRSWKGKADLAVCFTVIEHVADPLLFLKEIRALLKPNGELLLSTPNADAWLLDFIPDFYNPFFYRHVHQWYFNGKSIRILGKKAGFRSVKISYMQKFDISNALLWIRDRKPTGLGRYQVLSELDGAYRSLLEKSGRADYIYARFTK